MKYLLNQITEGLYHNLYYLSLFVSLAMPDICGALESNNGKSNKEKYIGWFNRNLGFKYKPHFSGWECWCFRCSLLHQGTSQEPRINFSRIIFSEPSKTKEKTFHLNTFLYPQEKKVLNIDMQIFYLDIVNGVEKWLKEKEKTSNYKKNYKKFIKLYPNGFPPYFKDGAVIT